ncbi:hypothetical protein M3212_11240 [Alkalihalobacillus oceani]|uniref:hypothetical protein n=1 Tax=Halalkalibacter oceani TaxID=1653776 RepID=UPI00203A4EF2|nr:hypothetical protein [Halalkalibacter oceani]MCM3761357.1 hypothetical protein [Halalkalibacter oceani]
MKLRKKVEELEKMMEDQLGRKLTEQEVEFLKWLTHSAKSREEGYPAFFKTENKKRSF